MDKPNLYNKIKFAPAKAKENVENVIDKFKTYFSSLGYQEESPVLISSGIDPTVRFIGSQISVFKPYFVEKKIPFPGMFIHQNCLRTRNANKLLSSGPAPTWGSYFPNLGAITPPKRLFDGCIETFDFLERKSGPARPTKVAPFVEK